MATKKPTPPTVSNVSRTDAPVAAPVAAFMSDDRTHQSQLMEPQVILTRLERLEENVIRDQAAGSERLLGSETLIAALIAKIEFLERRIEAAENRTQQLAIAQAEPITATLEVTSTEPTAAQLQAIEHKLHLLNNSIGAY
jgi:hypothetical protein